MFKPAASMSRMAESQVLPSPTALPTEGLLMHEGTRHRAKQIEDMREDQGGREVGACG